LRVFSDGGVRHGHDTCGWVLLSWSAVDAWGDTVWTRVASGSICLGLHTVTYAESVGVCEVTAAALSLLTTGGIVYDPGSRVKYNQFKDISDEATWRVFSTSRWS